MSLFISVMVCLLYVDSLCTYEASALYPACNLLGQSSPVFLFPMHYFVLSSLSECWSPHCVIRLVSFKESFDYLDVLQYSKLDFLESHH